MIAAIVVGIIVVVFVGTVTYVTEALAEKYNRDHNIQGPISQSDPRHWEEEDKG